MRAPPPPLEVATSPSRRKRDTGMAIAALLSFQASTILPAFNAVPGCPATEVRGAGGRCYAAAGGCCPGTNLQATSPRRRIHSAAMRKAIARPPTSGCSGAQSSSAPAAPSAITIGLLQTGHPTASSERTPPPAAWAARLQRYRNEKPDQDRADDPDRVGPDRDRYRAPEQRRVDQIARNPDRDCGEDGHRKRDKVAPQCPESKGTEGKRHRQTLSRGRGLSAGGELTHRGGVVLEMLRMCA